jgi:hypothetical protein
MDSNGNWGKATHFSSGTPAYVGFSFKHGGTLCYGWASLTITYSSTPGATYASLVVNSWAYEDSGLDLLVGRTTAVPEPAETAVGLGALALGAAGIRRWRKAKQAA